jgi:hypothetical protein
LLGDLFAFRVGHLLLWLGIRTIIDFFSFDELTNHGYSDGAASFYHLSNIIIILVLSSAFFESMAIFISL